jgi:hypothetical protein|nr:MAG TPA: Protein of unknown function (DUF551) [Caudoviricetes sp.]
MKQTIEEAARKELNSSYAIVIEGELAYQRQAMLNMFKKGAEWQLQQSTWVSVKDGLPHSDKMVLCQMKSNNAIVSGYITRCLGDKPQVLTAPDFEFDDLMDYEPIAWMPIPDCEEG